ncbi:N-6 DNA methylase [Neorhizobium galegae]|uniref:site-specific DNA-methyltransferase (adenine-specific) n=1 Tax=Neorhizobium galegae TaxID=399 RepID=A0A6A1TM85_NEOGA|nr:N-6 DNA methylase [Neorhizobium galegae]KAB1085316.1 N-6 DNA methylase [Neorhizobium galegae]
MTESLPLTLDIAGDHLGWPHVEAILAPKGAGAAVFADLVRGKIGRSLDAMPDARGIRLGVLMADAEAATSEPPLAIVAEFAGPVSEGTLRELHRLAWNFSHAPTLVTIEPTILKVWTCCEAPDPSRDLATYLVQHVASDVMSPHGSDPLEAQAARALHWINLVSGQFFLAHADRFHRDGRADQMLLGNLRHIRAVLAGQGLVDDDICHDLLARIIFVQFLFDRKDQDGKAALTPATLQRLQKEGVLAETHGSFASILSSYDDTYRLFDWLNTKFNGDLFPAKGDTDQARAVGWAIEKDVVRPAHLASLAEFIRGDVDLGSRQMSLWPQYAFDVIPLEFISSIYETFVTERAAKDGIFYTPPYLVDFILDQVLPWNGTKWDLKIIDPACGSGIFLVKAFQRLVHRWKLANPGDTVRAETLRRLLERNIFGVDKDQHAVRVACFSLYLAMCDEIEPRHYWTQVTFPPMRGRRLICSDFFTEGQTGFDTATDSGSYDLVLGNAPWGDGVITEDAKVWAKAGRGWSIPNKDIGGLFLAKGSDLAAPSGRVAMIQSANSLLFNISPKAAGFREQIFGRRRIEAIFNLSALRFKVFRRKTHTTKTSAAPACVVIMTPATPAADDLIRYVCPKHVRPLVDDFSILIEPQDARVLRVSDAISEPLIWSQLMWGAPRDLQLIRRLQGFPSLGALAGQRAFPYQQGLNFGDRKKAMPGLEGRRIFDETMFPADSFLTLDTEPLPVAHDLKIHSKASTGVAAFAWPQLIIKHSLNSPTRRFHARITKSSAKEGVLPNQSYFSVHADSAILDAACLAHNSRLAVYFHFLTSGRVSAYRPKLSRDEILSLPIPDPVEASLDGISDYASLDTRVFDLFRLNEAERVLIEDALAYTVDGFLEADGTLGDEPTTLGDDDDEAHLRAYCEHFIRVIRAGFGEDKTLSATIFRASQEQMPLRLVAFRLGDDTGISIQEIASPALLRQLEQLVDLDVPSGGGLFNRRIGRIYDASSGAPTIFLVKPDQKRFWTRSVGLHDGDEVALDLLTWGRPIQEMAI